MDINRILQSLYIFLFLCLNVYVGVELIKGTSNKTVVKVSYPAGTILLDGEEAPVTFFEQDDLYVPFEWMRNLEARMYIEEEKEMLVLPLGNRLLTLREGKLNDYVRQKPIHVSLQVFEKNGEWMVPLAVLRDYYGYDLSHIDEEDVVILWRPQTERIFMGAPDAVIRQEPSHKSPIIKTTHNEDTVTLLNDFDRSYYYVMNSKGQRGFLSKEEAFIQYAEREQGADSPYVPKTPMGEPIHMVWDAIYGAQPDLNKMPDMGGINVISPTWFGLYDTGGSVYSKARIAYSRWAHEHGMLVWPTFKSDFQNPSITHEVLSDFDKRTSVIQQLIVYAEKYEIDGLNIDFENVNLEDEENLVRFIEELTPVFHEAGLTVSIDATFLSGSENWSRFLDRERIGEIVDYMMIMAYDEHWAASPKAGSVASLPWVENGLKSILELVPSEKVVLGVPTYTRLWEETGDTVSSKALSMKAAENWIKENKAAVRFDNDTGQDVATVTKDGRTYTIWIENQRSLEKRIALVKQHNLAGTAIWEQSFMDEELWKWYSDTLKKP
ncbi:hypothetical protein IMZ31_20550 (plasmid) [Pontibacillus sp. ALD_SL1]|uniref:glycosyl hydrolase family 18 protein n=1 Tax=Pontibacillus sp. ALD_SL1 TaxID=2777185 RepID=UPI001A977D0D|nr:glycosyl hydrolase family 18 protein [Pontibacillus sp. ALD_SL1]QST02940.1 hypothetical protein IMZ31_20550 [Pontibacillus sp. ALD_SL1]